MADFSDAANRTGEENRFCCNIKKVIKPFIGRGPQWLEKTGG